MFAVPDRSPLETDLKDIRNLASRAHDELEKFFLATNAMEEKEIGFLGWRGPKHCSRPNSAQSGEELCCGKYNSDQKLC